MFNALYVRAIRNQFGEFHHMQLEKPHQIMPYLLALQYVKKNKLLYRRIWGKNPIIYQ